MKKRTKVNKKSPLTIIADDKRWQKERGLQAALERATALVLAQLLDRMSLVAKRAQATLLLTSDKAIKELNHDFRRINKPTNVLSFPHFTRTQMARMGKGREPVYVGDIAIAYQYTVAEAKKDNKILKNHVIHLLIHGLLHLFGYDHLTDSAAVRMERLEKKLMADLGLPNPYAPLPPHVKAPRTLKRKRA